MIAFTSVHGANRKSRDSKWVPKKRKGGVLAVSPEAGRFFSIYPNESMGYCGRYVCPLNSERKAFSYNKRTMDWAMGPF
jgi:hypothetical protein